MLKIWQNAGSGVFGRTRQTIFAMNGFLWGVYNNFPSWMGMAFLLFIGLPGCVNDPADVLAAAEKVKPSVERGQEVTIYYSDKGLVKMQLEAARVTRHLTDEAFMEFSGGVKVTFFDEFRQPSSTLQAGYAIRYEETQLTIIRENVVVVNEEGEQLNTEELIWDPIKKIIHSDQFVRIRTADEILFGTGFEADQEFSRYKILNPEGTLNIRDHEQVP
jgi:LPS export ABC transporter protein LptC